MNKTLLLVCVFTICDLFIAARPAQAQTETVLYTFCSQPNCRDGAYPVSGLTSNGKGDFYGATEGGGRACTESQYGCGTVFELSPKRSGGWNEKVIHRFTGGSDGAVPFSNVIFDSHGSLYGTTAGGGTHDEGTIFELSPDGRNWTETILFSFDGGPGTGPETGLIVDAAGNFYGISGAGVFELSQSDGIWTEQVIYSFDTCSCAAGLTMDAGGNIFGVGLSTVFELSPNGNGGWNSIIIHTFTGYPKDGRLPYGTPVLDQAGNLYGTTFEGGKQNYGTVYKLSPEKNGKWTERILHSFKDGRDGSYPGAGIVFDVAGNIYGTTTGGFGNVYELVAPVAKGGYRAKGLWSFDGNDGMPPFSSLILDSVGNLYGTAELSVVSSEDGVAFEVTP